MHPLRIDTPRLHIRNMQSSDLEGFLFYRSNPEVVQYQSFGIMTHDDADEFIQSQQDRLFGKAGEWVQYTIESRESRKIIGDCAIKLDTVDIRVAEIGITLSQTEQGKGYAKETFNALLDFLFAIPDFHLVEETVDAENFASIKLLESLGFRREGHFVENIFFKGHWGSEYRYAMLRKDWEAIRRV
jgi:ribosomal-protein-alanine N-acetyltransferase